MVHAMVKASKVHGSLIMFTTTYLQISMELMLCMELKSVGQNVNQFVPLQCDIVQSCVRMVASYQIHVVEEESSLVSQWTYLLIRIARVGFRGSHVLSNALKALRLSDDLHNQCYTTLETASLQRGGRQYTVEGLTTMRSHVYYLLREFDL
eukprot:PhF_6_TR24112/c0_g1_i2/m.33664